MIDSGATVPPGRPPEPRSVEFEDAVENFDTRRILFQSGGLLVVDKPANLPVHRGTGHDFGLAELLTHWASLYPGVIEVRPGRPVHPLHRLDREASGVILFGLTPAARRKVQAAIAARRVPKRYLTLVGGPMDPAGTIRGKVRSKLRGKYRRMRAGLDFRTVAGDERLSLLEVSPHEGYTHQIRSLLADVGRPVVGDHRYGKPGPARKFLAKFELPCLLLHARELKLPGDILGKPRSFSADLPGSFRRVLEEKGWDVDEIARTV